MDDTVLCIVSVDKLMFGTLTAEHSLQLPGPRGWTVAAVIAWKGKRSNPQTAKAGEMDSFLNDGVEKERRQNVARQPQQPRYCYIRRSRTSAALLIRTMRTLFGCLVPLCHRRSELVPAAVAMSAL